MLHRHSGTFTLVKTLALLLIPLTAACGRWGFDQAASSAAPDDPPVRLACGAPAKFSVGTTTSELTAAATPDGYNVFAVDNNGDVHGFTYQFETDTLGPLRGDVSVESGATGPIGSLALGDQFLLAMQYGRPSAKGTELLPLDAQLTARAQPSKTDAWYGSFSSLASANSGEIAFLGQLSNGEVDAKLVSPLGVDLGAAHPVISESEDASMPTILPAGTGFLVVWGASSPAPNEVHAEILDRQLAITTPATKISFDKNFDSDVPRAAYSSATDSFAFAWMEKTDGDQIWVSLTDGKLHETQHMKLGYGSLPAIAAGDKDFLVVWENNMQLNGARVTADGGVTPVGILGSGGKSVAWDLVVNNGQPAVVWVESGGTGPNLRLDPLCN
jgi:hypothetical protein